MNEHTHEEHQYLDLMRDLIEKGDKQTDKGTGVSTYSLFGRQMRYDLTKGFPMLTTKRVYWQGVLHELYWFLSGQSNIKYLVDNKVHIWDDYPYKIYKEKAEKGEVAMMEKDAFVEKIATDDAFAKVHGELPHIYGELWRRWPAGDGRSVDQLAWVIDELTKDPDAHNTIVSSWNPEYLYSMAAPGKACRFPICHNMYQVNIKEGRVCLQLYQRSADVFLGVPFNIASYALLTEMVAKVVGLQPGDFVHTLGDAHLYRNHFDQARLQLTRTPRPLPRIALADGITDLDAYEYADITIDAYDPYPGIKAPIAV